MNQSLIVPKQLTVGYPKPYAKKLQTDTLENILRAHYTHDAHFTQYAVNDEIGPYRLNSDIWKEGAFKVEMIALVFDVDSPAKKSGSPGALDEWWEIERQKLQAVKTMAWRTKGGARFVFTIQPRILASTDDAQVWKKDYLARLIYLEREYGILADETCCDWNRLQRVPFGRRDGENDTVIREHFGFLSECTWEPTEADRTEARKRFKHAFKAKKDKGPTKADTASRVPAAGDGAWYAYLNEKGHIKRELGPGKWAIVCPNETAHTSDSDTGTVLYAPEEGGKYGYIHCSHAHCQGYVFAADLSIYVTEQAKAPEEPVVETLDDVEAKVWASLLPDPKDTSKKAAVGSNVARILSEHPYWKGSLAFDRFRNERVWLRMPGCIAPIHSDDDRFLDADCTQIQGWLLETKEPFGVQIEHIRNGCVTASLSNQVDSYALRFRAFEGKWDGVPRLDTHLIDHFGAKDTPLNRAISARSLIAACKRSQEPGCVADMMTILEGEQEAGKNYYLTIMYGQEFIVVPDSGLKIGSKDFEQKTSDAGCIHDDELACLRSTPLDQVKSWITSTTSKYRKAYEREFTTVKRRSVLYGSANQADYLEDDENRRFWSIRLGILNPVTLKLYRDQIWSEAFARYQRGEEHRITKQDPLWSALAREHAERKELNPLQEQVQATLAMANTHKLEVRTGFTLGALMSAMGWQVERLDETKSKRRIGAALRHFGYVNEVKGSGVDSRRVWRLPHLACVPSAIPNRQPGDDEEEDAT